MSKLSTAFADLITAAIAAAINGGTIRIFSGAMPDQPYRAETGTLLGIVTLNGVSGAGLHFDSNGAAVTKPLTAQWAFKALATGTAGWFRIVAPGDIGDENPDAIRLDGSIGVAGGAPVDMVWESLALTAGVPYTIDSFVYLIQPIQ